MITINGKLVSDADGLSLAQFLAREAFLVSRVAVECNGEIVPKTAYECRKLADGDILEVVCFVPGG
jgi:sulfur carrier protein